MDELGLDAAKAAEWFSQEKEEPFILVRVGDKFAKLWTNDLCDALRRCYIEDTLAQAKSVEHGLPIKQIVASKLPNPGSVMAGDFGEVLVYIFHAAAAHPAKLIGPKKWRLKQDRTKASPHCDVVQFSLPTWPLPSADDAIFCSEVKTKSTKSQFQPVEKAIEGWRDDRTSRLANTLVWLRDVALTRDLGCIEVAHLNRFINTTEHPTANKKFHAVAVICASLEHAELKNVESTIPAGCSLIVIIVPDLRDTYMAVFGAAGAPIVGEIET